MIYKERVAGCGKHGCGLPVNCGANLSARRPWHKKVQLRIAITPVEKFVS